jgi:predicted Zn finger-like uncharacterized protein
MKIECPSCRLTGTINPVDLPPEGRNFECPKCRTSFYVAKPAPDAEGKYLMSICPVCQYSTFTDEMFAVCPKCGTKGVDYHKTFLKKSEGSRKRPNHGTDCMEAPPAPIDREQMLKDYELLTRTHRNPEFEVELPPEEVAPKPALPLPIRVTGWAAVAAGGAFLLYGLAGLVNYYGKDWQAILSVPFLEPVSKVKIFFQYGFFPWLRTFYAISFLLAASQFFTLRPWAPRVLTGLCWGGIGFMLFQELVGIINRILNTSGSPPAIFYVDCVISFLVTVLLWSAPFLAVIWFLRREETIREYPEATPCQGARPLSSP